MATGSKIPTGPRRQEDHVQVEERVHAIGELLTGGRDPLNTICQRNRVVFGEKGSHTENKVSGRKVPMRVENGVFVIDVHVKDLIDTGGKGFVVRCERR